jgi:hypothetical protein
MAGKKTVVTKAQRKAAFSQLKRVQAAHKKFDMELKKLKKSFNGPIWFRA